MMYKVEGPYGVMLNVEGPEGASEQEVLAQAQRLFAESPRGQRLAAAKKMLKDEPVLNPAEGMSNLDKLLAGAGKAYHDIGMGIQQRLASDQPDLQSVISGKTPKQRLEEQVAEDRRLTKPLMDTGAGTFGNVLGNAAITAPAMLAAPEGLLATAASSGAAGALQGNLTPTAPGESVGQNMAESGALGALLPVGGAGARALVGGDSPVRQAAAETLRKYGVDVSKSNEGGGILNSIANSVLKHAPVTGQILDRASSKDRATVREALFKMMGKDVPQNNPELRQLIDEVGSRVGAVGSSVDVPASDVAQKAVAAVDEAYKGLPATAKSNEALRWQAALGDPVESEIAQNGVIPGSAVQKMRSELSAQSMGAKGADKDAFKGMRNALDEATMAAATPEQRATIEEARKQYALASALRNVDVKEGGNIDLGTLRKAVETKARKGAQFPGDAQGLLSAADLLVPKAPTGHDWIRTAVTGASLLSPVHAAEMLLAPGMIKGALNTGAPQYFANNPLPRNALTAILRGVPATLQNQE